MSRILARLAALTLLLAAVVASEAKSAEPDTVVVRSGDLELRALLWRPPGRGPFPAVLFNHGSGHAAGKNAAGLLDHRHPELLGPVFSRHGYVFLYLFRRGDGLSRGQGEASGDRMDSAFVAGGQAARDRVQMELLGGGELRDALAGLAYLRGLPGVDAHRIAVVGHSFGGLLTLLLAERDSTVRAAVLFSAGGYSFDRSPVLRRRLIEAVDKMSGAALFLNARNDYSLSSSKALGAELARLGRPSLSKVYPAIGRTAEDGHDLVYLGISTWEADVFAFLDLYTR